MANYGPLERLRFRGQALRIIAKAGLVPLAVALAGLGDDAAGPVVSAPTAPA